MLFTLATPQQVKVGVLNRVIAKAIDLAIVAVVAVMVPYPLGPLLGFFYSMCGDGLNVKGFRGQSVGKRIMGLQVVNTVRKEPGTIRDSVLRNVPIGVATFFAIIPVWGWLILALIGLPIVAMEIYLMISVDKGHRLGDVIGDTEVIEVPRPSAETTPPEWPGH